MSRSGRVKSRQAAPPGRTPRRGKPPLVCPACGGENSPAAVFCANPVCHKALGEFRYVLEELKHRRTWHEALAERITNFIGCPHFVGFHALWIGLWIAVNTGLLMLVRSFDAPPFGLLSFVLGVEAIFITSFLLIAGNRQSRHADKRAELDYEVNVRTYREISEIGDRMDEIARRLDRLEARTGGPGSDEGP